MLLKNAFFLFMLILSHSVVAQDAYLKKRINRVDSLMANYYPNSEEIHVDINKLFDLLTTQYSEKKYIGYKIDVMLQKCFMYSINGEHSKALQLAFIALNEAVKYNYPDKAYRSSLNIAIFYEIGKDYDKCKKYLDDAYVIYKNNKLDSLYSVYCIRMSSYFNLIHEQDSALQYVYHGLDYARKYNNKREIRDAYLLLGNLLRHDDYLQAINYRSLAAKEFLKIEDFTTAASQYARAASILLSHNHLNEAMNYSDSSLIVLKRANPDFNSIAYKIRSDILGNRGKQDSAYYYFRKYHDAYVTEQNRIEILNLKKISEQYQNDKKEIVINNKNNQLMLIGCLLIIIVLGTSLLYRKNRQINKQNEIINRQVTDLSKTLEQKQMLLSELQHRVKNNLQHVISILEIQKESANYNNIDELIRSNQNRIHSMALLHKKLNVTDSVNEVDFNRYITELSELVKESYDLDKKKVLLNTKCEIEHISLEKALPIGLIITELVSNSMKHAFKNRTIGIIHIKITKDKNCGQNIIYYADNGDGFDFSKANEIGLGQEIIKGLIDQLDGKIKTDSSNGFELTVYFNA